MTDDDWFEKEKLHGACSDGDLPEVLELLDAGCDINAFDSLGFTPLHYAVRIEHIELIQLLISKGANVNAHDEQQIGETPLGDVAATCSVAVAKLLIKAGADPMIPGGMGLTALHRAAKRKKPEGIRVYEVLRGAKLASPPRSD